MSRKWERKVQRNVERINKQRKKQGKPRLEVSAGKPDVDMFKGRSVILPVFLASISIFFMIVPTQSSDLLQWVTAIMYFLLAMYFFFKRPYLAVGRTSLATRRLGRERWISADQIAEIHAGKGTTLIILKTRRSRWAFTKWLNGYPTEQMNARLKQFADQHGIPYHE